MARLGYMPGGSYADTETVKKAAITLAVVAAALAAAGSAQAAGSPLGSVNTSSFYGFIYGSADGGFDDNANPLAEPYPTFQLLVSTGYRHQRVTVKTTVDCHHELFDANNNIIDNEVSTVFTAKRRTPFTLSYTPTIGGATSCSLFVDVQRSYTAPGRLVARLFGIS
jgi:hypothetical protein